MMAKLVHLKRKGVAAHGQVTLCCLAPYLRVVFEVGRLDRLFEIDGDEQAALDAFQGIHPSPASTHLDIGTAAFSGESFEGSVQGRSHGVIGRESALEDDLPPVLLDEPSPGPPFKPLDSSSPHLWSGTVVPNPPHRGMALLH